MSDVAAIRAKAEEAATEFRAAMDAWIDDDSRTIPRPDMGTWAWRLLGHLADLLRELDGEAGPEPGPQPEPADRWQQMKDWLKRQAAEQRVEAIGAGDSEDRAAAEAIEFACLAALKQMERIEAGNAQEGH